MVLAAAAIAAGVPVYPIPGASAVLAGLVGSGLSTERFFFVGFLPPKAGARRSALEDTAGMVTEPTTLVFYEAPHRIVDTLADVATVWGPDCRIVLARELTKLHEEFLRGTVHAIREQLAARESVRGEMVLLVDAQPLSAGSVATSGGVLDRLAELEKSEGLTEKDALKHIARERGLSKSELWRELQRERARTK
jgi:16S rRNA (cytidine1402-2'-O)-methyltransferase